MPKGLPLKYNSDETVWYSAPASPYSPENFPSMSCVVSKYSTGKLYVGSLKDSYNEELLKEAEIKTIIRVYGFPQELKTYPGITYINIPIEDCPDANIQDYFDKTFLEIDESLNSQKNVLIHCSRGISRAPTVAAAYLIRKLRIPSNMAIDMIDAKRHNIDINLGFLLTLEDYAKHTFSE